MLNIHSHRKTGKLLLPQVQKMENYLSEGIRSGKSRYAPEEIFANAKKLIAKK